MLERAGLGLGARPSRGPCLTRGPCRRRRRSSLQRSRPAARRVAFASVAHAGGGGGKTLLLLLLLLRTRTTTTIVDGGGVVAAAVVVIDGRGSGGRSWAPTEDNSPRSTPTLRSALRSLAEAGASSPNRSGGCDRPLRRSLALIRGPPGTGKTRTAALIASALRLGDESGHPRPHPPRRPRRRSSRASHRDGATVALATARRMLARAAAAWRAGGGAAAGGRLPFGALANGRGPRATRDDRAAHTVAQRLLAAGRAGGRRHGLRAARKRRSSCTMRRWWCRAASARTNSSNRTCRSRRGLGRRLTGDRARPRPGGGQGVAAGHCTRSSCRRRWLERRELRRTLGTSPMARLEGSGVGQRTLQVRYRMPPGYRLPLIRHTTHRQQRS